MADDLNESDIHELIKASQGWYRFILRSKETLSGEERRLYDVILKINRHAGSAKPISSSSGLKESAINEPVKAVHYDELPTTPIPGPLQFDLIQKSKRK